MDSLRLFAGIVDVVVFTNQSGDLYVARFDFISGNTIIADMGIGRNHDLSEIGWIGKNLLVAGHPCIETDLAGGCSYFSGSFAIKYSSVSQ